MELSDKVFTCTHVHVDNDPPIDWSQGPRFVQPPAFWFSYWMALAPHGTGLPVVVVTQLLNGLTGHDTPPKIGDTRAPSTFGFRMWGEK